MEKPPSVRGLLDFRDELPVPSFAPEAEKRELIELVKRGHDDLEQWARLGKLAYDYHIKKVSAGRPIGRPKKSVLTSDDTIRALFAWDFVRRTRMWLSEPNRKFTNRFVIDMLVRFEEATNISAADRYFSSSIATLEGSLSRGKSRLQIDRHWHSEVCEKLMDISS